MPAAEVTAVCSAIPTSKKRSGQRSLEGQQAGGPGHGGRDGHHVLALLADFEHGLVEGLRVALDGPGRFGRAGRRVKSTGVVQAFFFVVFRRPVAPPLLGHGRARRSARRTLAAWRSACSMPAMSWPSMGPT